jgi:hypothetical protein
VVIEEPFLLAKRLELLKYTDHPHSLIPISGGEARKRFGLLHSLPTRY